MNIRAIFPAGVTEITVNGLHQWDFGQILEITADGLPALVEVHFACKGMTEAAVRSCSVELGRLTAAIPNACLEQTSSVVAWVYEVGETSGRTLLTVHLPITARTRPAPAGTVPQIISDKYTELVGAINSQVQALADGQVAVQHADSADKDATGAAIHEKYMWATAYESTPRTQLTVAGTYMIRVMVEGTVYLHTLLTYTPGSMSSCFMGYFVSSLWQVLCSPEGQLQVYGINPATGEQRKLGNDIFVCRIVNM